MWQKRWKRMPLKQALDLIRETINCNGFAYVTFRQGPRGRPPQPTRDLRKIAQMLEKDPDREWRFDVILPDDL